MNKYIAELLGTCWLVLGGCGAGICYAIPSIEYRNIGIALLQDSRYS